MSGWWVLAGLLLGLLLVVVSTVWDEYCRRPAPPSPLRQVETDYLQARRAMNQAAGQSWRDLTG